MEALADRRHPPQIAHLAVRDLPGSGRPAELMDAARIGPTAIIVAARQLVTGQ